jgi:hypothetical protein
MMAPAFSDITIRRLPGFRCLLQEQGGSGDTQNGGLAMSLMNIDYLAFGYCLRILEAGKMPKMAPTTKA